MRAYHFALTQRRLSADRPILVEELRERVAQAEALVGADREEEGAALLIELVERPSFARVETSEVARAAIMLLGRALSKSGIHELARAYLRQVLALPGAWAEYAPYARRAVREIVEIGLRSEAYEAALEDLRAVPADAPAEVRGEVAYLTGRAKESQGQPGDAMNAYAQVPPTSRFWSQATYLSGLLEVEKGRWQSGESLFCKVADPKRQERTAPVFADATFFAVRDLARLALGRIAHEQSRFDDARYYYYLVPRDSERLAEALYESATTRYEKKDYDGARELLDDLSGLKTHHRYEDEARVLDAYLDLARCKFPEADAKLQTFLATYEPVRQAARKLGESRQGTELLLEAARGKGGSVDSAKTSVRTEELQMVAALVRVDPGYREIARKRSVVERQRSGLQAARRVLADIERSLVAVGSLRPVAADDQETTQADEAEAALSGLRRQIDDLEKSAPTSAVLASSRQQLAALEAQLGARKRVATTMRSPTERGTDLPGLIGADADEAAKLTQAMDAMGRDLDEAERAMAQDAIHRLDLRLSRLLRRARLGRIESVLGKKRALEVEIEAINAGYLPRDAVDSLDAARYLEDNEEYWPFEGDDWPDEFLGSEGLR